LRAVVGIASLQHGVAGLLNALAVPHLIATGAAALLLIGLWTPFAGVLLSLAECFLAFSDPTDPSIHILLGTSGAALAMLGPGAWSVDARLFGRKRIQIPQR
jgi:uncharacterized membrane protein YphA (DoxX/SURF4 family)